MPDSNPATALELDSLRGSRGYVAPVLLFYDAVVYRVWCPHIWKCPTETILDHYRRHVRRVHLEAGCGTGYLPLHGGIPAANSIDGQERGPELTLVDLSPDSLECSARRLSHYAPRTMLQDLYAPLPAQDHPFESVSLSNVLHCLPGNFETKELVIANLKHAMLADGVLFGSTVLGAGGWHSRLARATLCIYNRVVGCFHNAEDTIEGLERALAANFSHVQLNVVGSLALFAASDGELPQP